MPPTPISDPWSCPGLAWSSSYQYRVAPGAVPRPAMGTMRLLLSHSPSVIAFSSVKPSQAMRAADREPAGGEIPVELVATSRLMTSLTAIRGVEDK